nr:hypothetical protein [Tanacetum cinerariifolium]
MSTQQDNYVTGFETRPPMLNKENYGPWSSRLHRYAKSRPNTKLIYNSIINGPYVRRMIPEPGDQNCEVPVLKTFHEQTNDELTKAKIKQMEADDQAIQTILLGLPEDIYVAVDSCETAQESWSRVQQMMKFSDIRIQEKKAKLFNEWERFTSTGGESIESFYHYFSKLTNDFKRNKHFSEKIASNLKFLNNLQPEWSRHEVDDLRAERLAKTQDPLALMANSKNPFNYLVFHPDLPSSSTFIQQPLPNNNYNLQPSFNQNYMQQPMPNSKDITDPTAAMNILVLMAKAFKLKYSTPTNNNQRISSNPHNRKIAQPGMNLGQENQMQMVGGNRANQFRQYARQNVGNQHWLRVMQMEIVVVGIKRLLNADEVTVASYEVTTGGYEQHFLMMDYALWKVIVNGDSPPPIRTVDGVEQTYPPTTTEEKLARTNELKAKVETTDANALVAQDGFGYDWSEKAEDGPTNFALMAYTSSGSSNSSNSDTEVNDKYKIGKGYHAVLPPYTGNFMPPKPDLILTDVDEYGVS